MYRRVVTSVPPSLNLVSRVGHGILETIPAIFLRLSIQIVYWYEPRAELTLTRRPLSARGRTRRGPLAGAGDLIKSNTDIR